MCRCGTCRGIGHGREIFILPTKQSTYAPVDTETVPPWCILQSNQVYGLREVVLWQLNILATGWAIIFRPPFRRRRAGVRQFAALSVADNET
jgi:hypothetical protein